MCHSCPRTTRSLKLGRRHETMQLLISAGSTFAESQRISMIKVLLALPLFWILLSLPFAGSDPSAKTEPSSRPPVKLTEEGLRIHHEAILIDGHNDLPWQRSEE